MCPELGWSGLEIAKLVVGMLTPLAVLGVGYWLNRRLNQVEDIQRANQTVVTRRMELFSAVAPKLNQLFCFATFVGRWKEITPVDAVRLKREMDEIMYANRILFSNELFAAYETFMATLFDTFTSADADAPLRVLVSHPRGGRTNLVWWTEGMRARFGERPSSLREVRDAYEALGQRFRHDLYVTCTSEPLLRAPPS